MEEVVNNEYEDEREITPENEYEGVIHRDMTENEKETIRDTLDKVIEECPDDTSPVDMEEGVNNEDDDEKEIMAQNEYEGVIHRYITDNEKETIHDTLDKVI